MMTKNDKKARRRKLFLSVYALTVPALWFVFFSVYALIIVCTLFFSGISFPAEYTVEYHVGEIEKKPKLSYEIKSDEVETESGIYVNFSELADVCSFPVSGDPDVLKYKIVNPDGSVDYLTVCINEGKVFVNSCAVSLPSGIMVKDESIYIPVDFVNTYLSGVNISFSEDEEKENTLIILVEGEYSLTIKNDSPNEKVDISGM